MAAETGPHSVSLRELARRANVSHSAPVHHFGTLENLLTCLATEGFEELNERLAGHENDIREMGVAYVLWALEHPGHYAVMWQPRHLTADHAELVRARDRAWSLLAAAVATSGTALSTSDKTSAYAAFALVHGLAEIWLSGALPRPQDPQTIACEITRRLFPLSGRSYRGA